MLIAIGKRRPSLPKLGSKTKVSSLDSMLMGEDYWKLPKISFGQMMMMIQKQFAERTARGERLESRKEFSLGNLAVVA